MKIVFKVTDQGQMSPKAVYFLEGDQWTITHIPTELYQYLQYNTIQYSFINNDKYALRVVEIV